MVTHEIYRGFIGYEVYLFDNEGACRGNNNVDEVKVAITYFLDMEVVNSATKLGEKSRSGFDVLHQRNLIEWPESISMRRRHFQ